MLVPDPEEAVLAAEEKPYIDPRFLIDDAGPQLVERMWESNMLCVVPRRRGHVGLFTLVKK
eukprot:2816988-Alexandrium_andersonii.AAC.1